jgi:adenylate kinase family enzyme
MSSPELLLVGGPPWSGKSSIARSFVELGQPTGVKHLSIGNLKRAIIAGDVPSAYKDQLSERVTHYPHHDVIPKDAITGIFEEFIQGSPNSLTVVDGYPRYPDRLPVFREAVERLGANVLAFCQVWVSPLILEQRAVQRRVGRPPMTPDEIALRLADHNETIKPTLEILAKEYPTYVLDGTLPPDWNARELLTIYKTHTQNK